MCSIAKLERIKSHTSTTRFQLDRAARKGQAIQTPSFHVITK
jgi:hypothetical protein